jgi:hypothetical protein
MPSVERRYASYSTQSRGKTAFHDWVNKGKIVRARDLTGYFLLNTKRVRLRMPPGDVTSRFTPSL